MADFTKLTDHELISLLKEGNNRAFTVIYERYFDSLFVNGLQMLKDREQARDVVQDVFTDLWVKRQELEIHSSLQGYLYAGIRHAVLNVVRRNKVSEKYIENLILYAQQDLPVTDDIARERELHQIIQAEIDKLPTRMKEVFELSRNHYHSHKEIAGMLDISEHTVKRQIANALSILRKKLDQLNFFKLIINLFAFFYFFF
ncbi:RNA polymerase sigma-70 factor, ECF subfamily [bacterium A37T11]|nr:RNA polymerase sigma-70 factor, ECF subfamily [bacterium A37T11]